MRRVLATSREVYHNFDSVALFLLLLNMVCLCCAAPTFAGWTYIGLNGYSVNALAIDPINPETIYAGAGKTQCSFPSGLFKSTDGGTSWSPFFEVETEGMIVASLAIDPVDPGTIYVGSRRNSWSGVECGSGGIHRITNGDTYRCCIGLSSGYDVNSLVIDPTNHQTVHAGAGYSNVANQLCGSVFKNSDALHATHLSGWRETFLPFVNSLAIDPINPQILYAGVNFATKTSTEDRKSGVYKSTDGGASWSREIFSWTAYNITSLAIDPENPSTIYAGAQFSGGVWKSTDGGTWWIPIRSGLGNTEVSSLAIDPVDTQILYAGTEAGVFKSTNGGEKWSWIGSGLTSAKILSLAIDPANPQILYAGTSKGGVFKSTDGGPTIPDIPTGVTATAGNGQATVSFTAPSSNGGSPITGYTATSNPGGKTGKITGATAAPITVTGLVNGTAYTFTVTATNAKGTGPASAPSNSVTPIGPPGAPTIGTATAGNAQATVSFTSPASNGGSPITGYTATSNPGGKTGTITGATAAPITVTGLTNGIAYTFTVTATNAVGTGPASSPSNSVTSASIIVTSPNGGETWQSGTSKTVTWTYTGNPGTMVKIELLRAGALVGTMTSGTPIGTGGNGSFTWNISSSITPGSDYKVRVTSTTTSSYSDTSNNNFTIGAPPSITVTSPNGGEAWQTGTSHVINWTYTGNPGTAVKIELLRAGALVGTMTSSTSIGTGGNGSFTWNIGSSITPGSDYKVRVTSTTTSSYSDTSNNNFTINSVPPSIIVTSPNGGETWQRGTSKTVTWSYTGNPGTMVKIELLRAGALVGTMTSSTSIGTGGNGSFTWNIGSSITPGSYYKVRVTSTTTSSYSDTSNNDFTISTPSPTVAFPNGGEILPAGSTQTIRWSYTGNVGTAAKIELLKAGAVVGTMTSSTPIGTGGIGSFTWNISSTRTPGSDYKVRVTSTTSSFYSDISDNAFTISGPPGAPTGVSATAGDASALIAFSAPASDGGSPITGYTATSSPGGITKTGAASPITITGLTNGIAYTFTVKATNSLGTGPASSPSNTVTPYELQVLHSFDGSDGSYPQGSLTLSGATLYGVANSGGTYNKGTIFQINTDGSRLQVLHSFDGSDGAWPQGSLTLSGATLYGVAGGGGTYNKGTIFQINTDGSGLQVLHSFDGSDGSYPDGSLTLSGATLYGMASEGGTYNKGTIFQINTDGSGLQVLHSFDGSDGTWPEGLTLSGATLYGVANSGGTYNNGTIFQINTDGSGLQVLHSFDGSDGAWPEGLTLSGATLYGVASEGGTYNKGTIFSLK